MWLAGKLLWEKHSFFQCKVFITHNIVWNLKQSILHNNHYNILCVVDLIIFLFTRCMRHMRSIHTANVTPTRVIIITQIITCTAKKAVSTVEYAMSCHCNFCVYRNITRERSMQSYANFLAIPLLP